MKTNPKEVFNVNHLVMILIFSLLIIPSSLAQKRQPGYPNEPNGFRNILFGTHIDDLNYVKFVAILETKYDKRCKIWDDKMSIGSADLKEIWYVFYKNRFYSVFIKFNSFLNFSRLKDVFEGLYGKTSQLGGSFKILSWDGCVVDIFMTYKEKEDKGEVIYVYKPIGDKIQKDDSLKGKGDL
jgi:hypothetical protein